MSCAYLAQTIIAKNAIEDEIKKLEQKLLNINNDIHNCESASNPFSTCSFEYRNRCNDKLKELYPQKRQLESQLNHLKGALKNINY